MGWKKAPDTSFKLLSKDEEQELLDIEETLFNKRVAEAHAYYMGEGGRTDHCESIPDEEF
jgi:hypothetical protein